MSNLKEHLFLHRVAILAALLTSLLVAFPQVYFRLEHKDINQGIELLPDSPWSPRIREIQDGNGFGNIYYKEGKDDPYLFQPLGSATVAYMGKVFGLEINNTILLSRFVLPFFTFILLYLFVYLLFRDRALALSSAALILLGDALLSVGGVMRLLDGVSPSSFLELARPVNSAMIFIPLFTFLGSFWKFYNTRNRWWGILSSILLGLNFYNYFYTWTYLYAFGAVLALIFLFKKEWRQMLEVSSVFAGAIFFLVPYALNLYRASLHPAYEEVSLRFGVVMTHTPLFIGFTAFGALVLFLIAFAKEDKRKYLFGLALLLTPFVTLNQQILTGKVLQPGHYHWYFHKPMAIIFVLATIFYLVERFSKSYYKKILAIAIVLVSFLVGGFIQVKSYYHDSPNRDGGGVLLERQKYGPIMKWLSENGEEGDVVFANNETSHMVVIYTPLNVFYHRAAIYTLAANRERLLDGLFTFYRLRDIRSEKVKDIFFAERDFISWNVYGMHYKEALGAYEAIPDDKIEEVISFYQTTLQLPKAEWLKNIWNKYEVKYVVWDMAKDPTWNIDQLGYMEKVVEFDGIAIYTLR